MTEDLAGTPSAFIDALSRASLEARPWRRPGRAFRCMSIHDGEVHAFHGRHPFVGRAHVQVDDIALTMFLANDDGVALIYHAFGPDAYESASVAAWLEVARTCGQIVDGGAFTGLFAMLAKKAAPVASVLAIEPNSASRARLFMNCVWNHLHLQVQVAACAVSSAEGVVSLYVPMGADLLDTGSSLVPNEPSSRTEIVRAASIDSILSEHGLGRPDLMKIDVEGLEVAALQGAARVLEARPTLFLEVQAVELYARCRGILQPLGYRMLAIDDDSLELISDDPEVPLEAWYAQHVRGRAMNYLCVAREEHLVLARRGVGRVRAMLGRPIVPVLADPTVPPLAVPRAGLPVRAWRRLLRLF